MQLPPNAYLRDIFDQSDSQLDVGEDIEVVEPGKLVTNGYKEGDEYGQPHGCQDEQGGVRDSLLTTLERERGVSEEYGVDNKYSGLQ